MSKQDIDSKKKSASEAFVNSFGAYPIGYGIGIMILPLSIGWINEDPLMANVFITLSALRVRRTMRSSSFQSIKNGVNAIQS